MPESQTPPNRTPPSGRAGTSPPARSWRERLDARVESGPVQGAIIAVIVANAVTLGLQTSPAVLGAIGGPLAALDAIFLAVFVVELLLKLVARGPRFFLDGWNVFDFLVVGIALVPGTGPLAVLRALRVLRVLRLVSAVPKLRFVVAALFAAIPGIASIGALLCIIFYVFAVMATGFFGAAFPEWFGSIGASLYSLFQIMTLESWSMGIVRPVMEVFPWAWAFFVPFILLSSFTILNLFIAVIVDTMQNLQDGRSEADARQAAEAAAPEEPTEPSDEELAAELRRVRSRLDGLVAALERRGVRPEADRAEGGAADSTR